MWRILSLSSPQDKGLNGWLGDNGTACDAVRSSAFIRSQTDRQDDVGASTPSNLHKSKVSGAATSNWFCSKELSHLLDVGAVFPSERKGDLIFAMLGTIRVWRHCKDPFFFKNANKD
jgi:hypothetical protein